ncbi:MAG: hypothetical protein ACLQGP_32630 [Isosphaeraceae bacterium]
MLARAALVALISVACFTQQSVEASPITFDFTGNFGMASNGTSTPFSGSFTINGNPTVTNGGPNPYGPYPYVSEEGSDVSLTVNMGGQVFNFANTASQPNNSMLLVEVQPTVPGTPNTPLETEFLIKGSSMTLGANFALTVYSPGVAQLTNLSSFNFNLYNASVEASDISGVGYTFQGGITSIEIVSNPEPGTLAIFAVLALTGLVYQRRRRLSRGATQ